MTSNRQYMRADFLIFIFGNVCVYERKKEDVVTVLRMKKNGLSSKKLYNYTQQKDASSRFTVQYIYFFRKL